jgi:hypothetical protein
VRWVRDLREHHARRVARALAGYGVVAAALVELTEPIMPALHLPEWTLTFVVTEPYVLAEAYAWRGDRDRAFEWLDRAVTQRGGRGVSRLRIRWIKNDPLLAPIRGDPRNEAVLRRIGLPVG